MEKWLFDGIEGQVRKYVVDEEVVIVEDEFVNDEFVNDNSCNKCRTSEERIRNLEAALEKEKRDHAMIKTEYSKFIDFSEKTQAELTKKHQDLMSIIYKHLTEKNSYMRDVLAKLREK